MRARRTWYLRFDGVHTRAYPTVQLSHAHQQADIEELVAPMENTMIGLLADGVQVLQPHLRIALLP